MRIRINEIITEILEKKEMEAKSLERWILNRADYMKGLREEYTKKTKEMYSIRIVIGRIKKLLNEKESK